VGGWLEEHESEEGVRLAKGRGGGGVGRKGGGVNMVGK